MTTESTPTETFESKVSSTIDEAASEGERMLARVWKIIAANGVAAILFGFVLVLWPDIGLTTIVAVVAVYALVRGVLSGLAAFSAPLPRAERGWLTLEAVAGTAIGIALLVWNDISAQALLYVVAAWALAIGVLMLAAAIQAPLEWPAKLLLALNGIISERVRRRDVHRARRGRRRHRRAHRRLHHRHRRDAGRVRARAAQCRRRCPPSPPAADHRKARGARLTSTENESGGRRSVAPAAARTTSGSDEIDVAGQLEIDDQTSAGKHVGLGRTRVARPLRYGSAPCAGRGWPRRLSSIAVVVVAAVVAGWDVAGWLGAVWKSPASISLLYLVPERRRASCGPSEARERRARVAPAEADGSIHQPEARPPPRARTSAWTETESTASRMQSGGAPRLRARG